MCCPIGCASCDALHQQTPPRAAQFRAAGAASAGPVKRAIAHDFRDGTLWRQPTLGRQQFGSQARAPCHAVGRGKPCVRPPSKRVRTKPSRPAANRQPQSRRPERQLPNAAKARRYPTARPSCRRSSAAPKSWPLRWSRLLIIVVVAVLYLARAFFLPITMAFIVGTMLSPAASLLERYRIPRAVAAVLIVTAASAGRHLHGRPDRLARHGMEQQAARSSARY